MATSAPDEPPPDGADHRRPNTDRTTGDARPSAPRSAADSSRRQARADEAGRDADEAADAADKTDMGAVGDDGQVFGG